MDAAVAPGSAIFGHARTNTTSVYTVSRIFPMLPERLSTDLTSLNEGEDRLSVVVELRVAKTVPSTSRASTAPLVRNRAKLAYDAVAAWLDGEAEAPAAVAATPGIDAQVVLQDRVGQALRSRRHHRGALTLETTASRVVFDGDALADLRTERRTARRR